MFLPHLASIFRELIHARRHKSMHDDIDRSTLNVVTATMGEKQRRLAEVITECKS